MIESERKMPNGVLVTFCEFTTEEHYSMAKFVLDCLCLPWIDNYSGFHGTLREIFIRSADGKDITREQAFRLADKYERFFKFGLPQFPKIRDGGRLMAPMEIRGEEIHGQDAVDWLIAEKKRIWHEQWEEHKEIRVKGGFWMFPHGKPDEVFMQMQANREERFWAEVSVREKEYGCSRSDAIIAVSDYMPRAESELQLRDPNLDNA